MSVQRPIPQKFLARIDQIVDHYRTPQFQSLLENFRETVCSSIQRSVELRPRVHSLKSRLKDPEHLREKLCRRYRDLAEKRQAFDVDVENLAQKITDLAGVRVLHLYTKEFEFLHRGLKSVFDEYRFKLMEKPFARTWDDEYSAYFRSVGVGVQKSPSMYTSVHYVIG